MAAKLLRAGVVAGSPCEPDPEDGTGDPAQQGAGEPSVLAFVESLLEAAPEESADQESRDAANHASGHLATAVLGALCLEAGRGGRDGQEPGQEDDDPGARRRWTPQRRRIDPFTVERRRSGPPSPRTPRALPLVVRP